ncbi:MAG TPA: recombinase family protein [Acidimicrobiales bacterium]|nr:recombinase family protein [Acidimicrobiales bacterium]
MKTKVAAIYARVSTAEQVQGTSLESQVAQCETYVAAQGWELAGRFVDEGVSGAKARRPALDQLTAAVNTGGIDVVVVAKLDRIGRSMRHLTALLGELDDRGVNLVSVSEAFDSSTPSGRLQRNMLASFAEFEREQIRERLSEGRDAVVRRGKYVSTIAPYGYRIDTDGDNRCLVIDPDEAAVIRLMVDMLVELRMTTGQAAAELNARGIRPRLSPRWNGHAIRNLLRNADHLSGTWTWRHPRHQYRTAPITLEIPAILDAATHERLKGRLADSSQPQTRRTERYLLAGRIRSPHNTPMWGLTNGARVYRCSEVFASNAPPGGRTCDCRPVRGQDIEDRVWAEVCDLLADPQRLMAMAGLHLARANDTTGAGSDDLAAIDRRIKRLEKAAGDRLARMLADGLDSAIADQVAKQLSVELDQARRHREKVAAWQTEHAERQDRARRLIQLAERARHILPGADTATKARILDLLEVQVKVTGWQPCEACRGIGYISQPAGEHGRGNGRPRGNAAKICPTCRRHRHLPTIEIEGIIPEADLDTPDTRPDAPRWPFKVAQAGS